jgi:hypothetical protein
MSDEDRELMERFNGRLAAIEAEIPEPPRPYAQRASSVTRGGGEQRSRYGWISALVVAIAALAVTVILLRSLPGPNPEPSAPAVGNTAVPSPITHTPSPAITLPLPTAAPDATHRPGTTPTLAPSTPPITLPSPTTSASAPTDTATPEPTGWIGPDRVAAEHFEEISLAVDANGFAHVAAATWEDGSFYLTNSGGSWTREPLTTPPIGGYDGEPSIVIRPDGSLAVAFTRFGGLQCSFGCIPVDPQGVFLITNQSGSWSDAERFIDGRVQEPSLQATQGRLHIAYSRGADLERTVEYAYAEDGVETWTASVVGPGRSPSLRIGRDGLARLAYTLRPFGQRSLFYAEQTGSNEFVTERVPGGWVADTTGSPPLLALDPADEPRIVFFNETEGDDEPSCALSIRRAGSSSWSEPSEVFREDEFCQLEAADAAVDSSGTVHVISDYNLSSMGVWYANDAGGEFQARRLRGLGGHSISDVPDGDSEMALDDLGRPHVLYVVLESERGADDGLWYGIGPAQ